MAEDIKKIMNNILGVDKERINDDTNFKNTEKWDSLKHMELVVAFEEAFNVEFTADEIVNMLSFIEIKKVLTSKGVKI